MSNETVISMRELEAESVELLPSRETLNCWRSSHGGSTSVVAQNGLVNLNNSSINVLNGDNIANIGLLSGFFA